MSKFKKKLQECSVREKTETDNDSSVVKVILDAIESIDDDDFAAIENSTGESEEIARAIADSTAVDDGLISIDPISVPLDVSVDGHASFDEVGQIFEECDLSTNDPQLDVEGMVKALEGIF